MHHKHKQARIVMLVSLPEPAQTHARMHHKHKHARNINPLLGGSLEGCGCSCREFLEVASFVPEQGSHTAVLDGSLFEKEQGGHTFVPRPHGAATIGGSNRSQRRRRPNTVHPSRLMGSMVSVEVLHCTGSPRRRRARHHRQCRPRRFHLAPKMAAACMA
jgi:hypothetical protein